MSSNPNRNTPTDATTVKLPVLNLHLCVRCNHELGLDDATLADDEPTVELPMLLRRQAE